MTDSTPPGSRPRRLSCARCGTAFDCGVNGGCWCAAEPYRMPLNAQAVAEDCLCPDCLRRAAAQVAANIPGRKQGTTA
jgi:hypothetical protein